MNGVYDDGEGEYGVMSVFPKCVSILQRRGKVSAREAGFFLRVVATVAIEDDGLLSKSYSIRTFSIPVLVDRLALDVRMKDRYHP